MLWKIFGPVINPHKNKHKTQISKLVTDLGDTLTGSNEISNEFNQYFSSVGKKLSSKKLKLNCLIKHILRVNLKIASSSHQQQKMKFKKLSQILIPKRQLGWITLSLNYLKHVVMN